MRPRRRWVSVVVASLVVASIQAVTIAVAPSAHAADSSGVSFTLEGCRNNGGITLPNGSGQFVCPDAAYTTGNLGKGWNELDLVPFRLTASAGNSAPATQTYTIAVVLDNLDAGHPGYDVLSTLTLNTTLSSASCTAAGVGAQTTLTPGLGGIDRSIYRLVTITQGTNTNCVYDYYGRLALGSHLFPGASLHANLANEALGTAGVGSKDVSIPVKEISPQSLSKDMTATQGSDHIWSVTKEPSTATLNFANTCDPAAATSQAVDITVSWKKMPAASGVITILTHVYATNPASRSITANITDVIYSGVTPLDTVSTGPVVLPPNTTQLVLTHTTTVASGTTGLNDVATGTYTDTVTGIPIPGSATATASATVQPSGVNQNNSATITDVESLIGAGLQFSVTSTTGATGTFGGGYQLGTPTTGPLSWTSDTQSGDSSVIFHKLIYDQVASETSGTLSDTATLTGSDGFTADSSASVAIATHATTSLNVSKSTSLKLAAAQTFIFHLWDGVSNSATGDTATVTIPALSNGPVASAAITGLNSTGTYFFKEDANAPYPAQSTSSITFSLTPGDISTCSATVSVSNQAAPATAQVQKVTSPASSGLWTFTLTGPNLLSETLNNVQADSGYALFASSLDVDGGAYTITETPQAGYDLTNVIGDLGGNAGRVTTSKATLTCSFTLNLATDSGKVFECTFTNTMRGSIIVKKVTNPVGAPGSFTFTGDAAGSIGDGGTITVNNLTPGTYTSTETDPTPGFDLTTISCDDGASTTKSTWDVSTRTATFHLDPGETVTCTFTNTERGHARVVKTVSGGAPTGGQSFTFQLRTGASAVAAGTTLETLVANAGNGGIVNFATFLVPGTTYQLCEQMMPGWMTSLGPPIFVVYNPSGDNSVVCTDFTVTAGQTKIFNIDNTPPPGGGALTIGFWKNWSSCTGGKQKAVLDQTLLALANAGTPETLGLLVLNPNTLGTATACKYAVNLLSKSTISSGSKKASDPLFNMTAQLLAADMNVAAGAGTCPSAVSAINQAHALLTQYKFDGNGYTPKLTSSDAALANSLQTTLEKYNSNLLC